MGTMHALLVPKEAAEHKSHNCGNQNDKYNYDKQEKYVA